jgi:hypothetical protein
MQKETHKKWQNFLHTKSLVDPICLKTIYLDLKMKNKWAVFDNI